MTPDQAERWRQIRRMGRARFVLRYGIAGWALPVALAGLLLIWLATGQPPGLGFVLFSLLISVPLFGLIAGLWYWHEMESKYRPK